MIRYKSNQQLNLEGFHLPFGGQLNPENRWVKWSHVIPWDELSAGYYQAMDTGRGRPCQDARLIIGALIIKHKLNLSDAETVLQIRENPYLQYCAGLASYKDDRPFAPSLFVEIRKRMGAEVFTGFERTILEKLDMVRAKRRGRPETGKEELENKGKLVIDATVVEQSIRYPTDISLLSESL